MREGAAMAMPQQLWNDPNRGMPRPMDVRASRCRGCGAAIFWLPTTTGSKMPINYQEDPAGNVELVFDDAALELRAMVHGRGKVPTDGRPLFRSHFATCTRRGSFRR